MRRAAVVVVLAALTLFSGSSGFAQQPSGELKKELEALKAGQARIEKELQDLKNLLQARPAPSPGPPSAGLVQSLVLSVGGAPFKGDKNAKVTLVDFTDYQ